MPTDPKIFYASLKLKNDKLIERKILVCKRLNIDPFKQSDMYYLLYERKRINQIIKNLK